MQSTVVNLNRTGDRSYLRRRNSLAVLEALWHAPATVAELARATSLSRTAAESVLADLVAAGWAADYGMPPAGVRRPGRPASLFSLAPEAGHLAGIDIGAHHVSAAVSNLRGEILATAHRRAEKTASAPSRIAIAIEALAAAVRDAGIDHSDLWSVTVGTPGVIDCGKVIHFGGEGMPGWAGLDIPAQLEHAFSAPVLVEGDSALGAMAESVHGVAHDVPDFVYLLSGVRTGAAIVAGGEVHRGHRGGAGLVGELPELRWRDLEQERYGTAVIASPRPSRSEIFARAAEGDLASSAAVEDFADALAVGASVMALAVDPELLVLGGPNAQHADLFLDRFVEQLAERCPLPPRVVVSTLGSDAVLVGTVTMGVAVLRRLLRESVESLNAIPAPEPSLVRQLL